MRFQRQYRKLDGSYPSQSGYADPDLWRTVLDRDIRDPRSCGLAENELKIGCAPITADWLRAKPFSAASIL
ncbi:hypothetical protein KCP73_08570 [Salmonella enterica subsp. enterica]|nr:hypothetical protein KCP73_08570 [Salmonella enterica subsp. enterica]